LSTSWVGEAAAKEPWDSTCTDEDYVKSVSFWSNNALCDDGSNPVNRDLVSSDPNSVGYFNRRLALPEVQE
jgi:hypothetical protein